MSTVNGTMELDDRPVCGAQILHGLRAAWLIHHKRIWVYRKEEPLAHGESRTVMNLHVAAVSSRQKTCLIDDPESS